MIDDEIFDNEKTNNENDKNNDNEEESDIAAEIFYDKEEDDTKRKNALEKLAEERSKKKKSNLNSMSPAFSVESGFTIPKDKITLNYLYDIFSEEYDKYKSKEYLIKTREELLKTGYADGPALNEYLYWTTISRRLHITYQETHINLVNIGGISREDVEFLKRMTAVSGIVSKLQETLENARIKKEKSSDVVDLFTDTMKEANAFIKKNTGEFSLRCKQCGTIIQSDGMPYFSINTDMDKEGNKIYHIFSPEAAYLVKNKIIPLHIMAFILRTSPEGILYTAKERGDFKENELLHEGIKIEDEENKLKEIMSEFNEFLGTNEQM